MNSPNPPFSNTIPRQWQVEPSPNSIDLGRLLRKSMDSSDIFSVYSTAVLAFIISGMILVFFKPSFVFLQEQLSFIRILFFSFLASGCVGLANYFIYKKI